MERKMIDIVIDEFKKICEIPHPSHHEQQISQYLYDWARERGLEVQQDELLDVIIDKPATSGYENAPLVIFQAHMDMVCVAEEGVKYDPLTDPIKVIDDGKTLSAQGTSLGGDDGIGVAMCLYLLQSSEICHGPIRAIFTTNEEDGMDSMNIDPRYLEGDYLINLDWEAVGSLCNSCAGSDFFKYSRKADWEEALANSVLVTINLNGLLGGHSGIAINKGHANAIVSLATLMTSIHQAGIDFNIAGFEGGQAINAIPKFSKISFAIARSDVDKAKEVFETFAGEFKDAFANIEPDYQLGLEVDENLPRKVLGKRTSAELVGLMATVPNNVHTMSPFVDGLVESSANLGKMDISDESIEVNVFARSSVDYHATQMGVICRALSEVFGFELTSDGRSPGWAANPNSKLTRIACDEYRKLTGRQMVVEPVHAGIECGAFAKKNPRLDMISIGPTLLDVHTPDESCNIEDVRITTELIAAILGNVASDTKK